MIAIYAANILQKMFSYGYLFIFQKITKGK